MAPCLAATAMVTLALAASAAPPRWGASDLPPTGSRARTVYFPSADGRTELVGYLFKPDGVGPFLAVIMLHGRAGPYSANVTTHCDWVRRGPTSPCGATTQQSARAGA